LVGLPLTDSDQTRYLFRLAAAEPQRAAGQLDAVRSEVEDDYRRRQAYLALVDGRQQQLQVAIEQGLEALAKEVDTSVTDIPLIPRRQFQFMSGSMAVPIIPGVGQNQALVEALFETAKTLGPSDDTTSVPDATPDTPGTSLPPAERYGVISIDDQMKLAVYRIDDYQPMTRAGFDQWTASGQTDALLNQLLLSKIVDTRINYQQLKQRLGYEMVGQPSDEEQIGNQDEASDASAEPDAS
jgi:hypothetical protein